MSSSSSSTQKRVKHDDDIREKTMTLIMSLKTDKNNYADIYEQNEDVRAYYKHVPEAFKNLRPTNQYHKSFRRYINDKIVRDLALFSEMYKTSSKRMENIAKKQYRQDLFEQTINELKKGKTTADIWNSDTTLGKELKENFSYVVRNRPDKLYPMYDKFRFAFEVYVNSFNRKLLINEKLISKSAKSKNVVSGIKEEEYLPEPPDTLDLIDNDMFDEVFLSSGDEIEDELVNDPVNTLLNDNDFFKRDEESIFGCVIT